MAKMLMNLRGVPDDEVEEVRDLLERHAIEFYETEPNFWGLSMGAIWLRHDDDHAQARRLMDEYQRERARRMREEHVEAVRQGTAPTIVSRFLENPLRTVFYLAVIGGILYFMLWPFLRLALESAA